MFGVPPLGGRALVSGWRSEEHTSELQSHVNLVCRLLLEKKNIAASFGDARLQIVRNDDLGHAAQKLEGAHVVADPVGQPLCRIRLGVREVTCAQHGHEDRRRRWVAASSGVDGYGVAGVIDKQLLTRTMLLPQNDFLPAEPPPVEITESAVMFFF